MCVNVSVKSGIVAAKSNGASESPRGPGRMGACPELLLRRYVCRTPSESHVNPTRRLAIAQGIEPIDRTGHRVQTGRSKRIVLTETMGETETMGQTETIGQTERIGRTGRNGQMLDLIGKRDQIVKRDRIGKPGDQRGLKQRDRRLLGPRPNPIDRKLRNVRERSAPESSNREPSNRELNDRNRGRNGLSRASSDRRPASSGRHPE
jgi:hypothetical protein